MEWTDATLETIEAVARAKGDEMKGDLAHEVRRLRRIMEPSAGAKDAIGDFIAKRRRMTEGAEPSPPPSAPPTEHGRVAALEREVEELCAGHRKLFDRVRDLENATREAMRHVSDARAEAGARLDGVRRALAAVL